MNIPLINSKIEQKNYWLILALITTSVLAVFISWLAAKDPFWGLICILSVVLVIIFIKRPEIGIYLILFSILAGQLIKIPLSSGSGIIISDILVPSFLIIWFLSKVIRRDKLEGSLLGPLIFLFLGIAVISYINGLRFLTNNQAILALFYLVRLVSYTSLFYVALNEFKTETKIYDYKKILIILFVIFAVIGLIQLAVFPNLAKLAREGGWDPHSGRLFATFLDPNFAGAFLTMGFIFALGLLYYTRSIEGKLVLIMTLVLTLVAIILTYSRSSYLFLAISFFVFAFIRSKKLILLGLAVIIIVGLLFPRSVERLKSAREIDESARQRFTSWGKTIEIVKDHPILGVGYNSYRFAQERYTFIKEGYYDQTSGGSDSSLLTIIVTTGFLGLIAYLIFYIAAIKKTLSVMIHSDSLQKKGLSLALASILIGLIFHSLFVNSLLYPAIMIPLFTTLGLISTRD